MSFQCLVLWWWSLSQEHSLLIFTQPKVFNFSRTPLIRIIISGQRRCGENTGVALSGTQFQAMTCSSSSRCCIQSFPRHSFNVCTSDFRRGLACTFDKNLHAWDLSWQDTKSRCSWDLGEVVLEKDILPAKGGNGWCTMSDWQTTVERAATSVCF